MKSFHGVFEADVRPDRNECAGGQVDRCWTDRRACRMDRQTVGWQSLVECTGLENRRALTGPGGSNPSPPAAPNSPLSLAGRDFLLRIKSCW